MNLISQLSLAYGFEAYMPLILIPFLLLLCYQITIQRTELNSPLGLEVQLHITEAVCPALSEPGMLKRLCIIWMFLSCSLQSTYYYFDSAGLRAFLRFLTGLYACINRGDVNPNQQV